MRNSVRNTLLTAALIVLIITASNAQGLFAKFVESYNTKDYKTCVESGKQLTSQYDHPGLSIQLAECHCGLREFKEASEVIKQLATKGVVYNLDTLKTFRELMSSEFAVHIPQPASVTTTTAFSIQDLKFVPEGIAYDGSTKRFFVGSLAQNRIVAVDKNGKESDFFIPPNSECWQFVGIKIFGNQLWACAFSEYTKNSGQSAVFNIDTKTGKLNDAFYLREGVHLLNDLVKGPGGEMYITDSKAGLVYELKDGVFKPITGNSFIYPNGIAINNTGDKLFIADWKGISVLDLKTDSLAKLETAVSVNSIDGLYWYNGDLIAIQGLKYLDRVARISLKDGKATGITELARLSGPGFPTTGVIVNDSFYFISNAFVTSVKADGVIANPEALRKSEIKQLSLGR